MAKHKKIYENKARARDKKRERIRKAVSYCLVAFWIITICICGVFQNNSVVVGIGVMAIGIVNGVYSAFAFTTRILGWKTLTIYDSDELYRDKHRFSEDLIEKQEDEIKTIRLIADAIIAVTAVAFIIIGLNKLF